MGDDIQAIKAGILEIADILVINKADLAVWRALNAHSGQIWTLGIRTASMVKLVIER
jgi:putative protein kinase ArgK-like GTPase of G3E family